MPAILGEIIQAATLLFIACISSILLLPLSLVIPKKNNRIVVFGRQKGLFTDNAKHFYLFLRHEAKPEPDVFFVVSDRKYYALLAGQGENVLFYPSPRAIFFLLTANIVITDNTEWIEYGKFQLTFGSKVVQLYHGAPLKQIELPLYHERIAKYPLLLKEMMNIYKLITGRYAMNEMVLSTSVFFTEKIFKTAFNAKHFIETGYPRNDSLFEITKEKNLGNPLYINTDQAVIKKILAQKNAGSKVYIYAPTFRKGLADPFPSDVFDLNRLDSFATEHNLFFVFKLHPAMAGYISAEDFSNITEYKASCDIYPALNLCDALITDYSSIYFDYLLVDRSVIFFPYDYDDYINSDRPLLFDYKQMAPGHICMTQEQLEQALLQIEVDTFSKKRKEVRKLVFTYADNQASARLWKVLFDNYIK